MPTHETGPEPITQPNNPVGYGTWVNKVWIPKDGDTGKEATWLGIMDLVNRTTWLAWRCIDIRNGGSYTNATVQFNGPIVFGASSWPLVDPARPWERHGLELMGVSSAQESTDGTDSFFTNYPDARIAADSSDPYIETRPIQGDVGRAWLRMRDLPDGATLSQVKVSTKGADAPTLTNYGTYRLGRRKGRAAIEWIAAAVNDAHVIGNFNTTEVDTTVFSGSHTVDKDYQYFVYWTLPYAGGGPANPIYLYNVKASGTAGRLGL